MLPPQREREKRLAEMAPIVKIFAVLFIAISFPIIFPIKDIIPGMMIVSIFMQLTFLLISLFIVIFVLEAVRNKIINTKDISQPIWLDYVTLLGSIVFITILIFIAGDTESNLKIFFLPTILFYTVRFGQKWGLSAAGVITLMIILLHTYHYLNENTIPELGFDLIYIGIFFLTAWLVGSIVNIERSISDRLSREVIIDDLTGLFNHRYFQDSLDKFISQNPPKPFGLIMADLDFFKHYNSTYGHQAGDRLLVNVARIISGSVRDKSTVFRFGSDEFALILPGAGREETLKVAEDIRIKIKDSRLNSSSSDVFWQFHLTVSLGVALFPDDATSKEELLKKVDEALYKAKVISGNKVEAYFSLLEQIKSQADDAEQEVLDRLKTLLAIINARDRYTYGHSERVLIYTGIIASLMELPPEEKRTLQYGAYLHDIGKIEIDRSILNKPGVINEEEWGLIKNHPLWGAELIRQVKVLDPAVPMILYHHERYDGGGYPFGIGGQAIPLHARILAVADAFDAMTVERPYKQAKSFYEAIQELKHGRGTQFDPDITDIFIKFLEQHRSIQDILQGSFTNSNFSP